MDDSLLTQKDKLRGFFETRVRTYLLVRDDLRIQGFSFHDRISTVDGVMNALVTATTPEIPVNIGRPRTRHTE